jgi:hypothetical protein
MQGVCKGLHRPWSETRARKGMGAGGESASKGRFLPKLSSNNFFSALCASLRFLCLSERLYGFPKHPRRPSATLSRSTLHAPRFGRGSRATRLGPTLPPRCRRMRNQFPSPTRLGSRLQGIRWRFLGSGLPKRETSRVPAADPGPAPCLTHKSCRVPANYRPLERGFDSVIGTMRERPAGASTDYA